MPAIETYLTLCWNCLGEFDALNAVWCSCDPKNPTKLCPFCFRCFCDASEKYKQEFWKTAPSKLVEEIQVLSRSKDRLGDILIRTKKLTTPQLLEALVEQRETGKKLGEVLLSRKLVKNEDIQQALRSQGVNPLTDTMGAEYAASPVWEQSAPDAIIQYIMGLAAKKGASDVHIEPTEDSISVKYRIDGFFFRVDPIPKKFQGPFTHKLFDVFRLDAGREGKPQTARSSGQLGEHEFDFVAQTLPTAHGVSATIKLINRSTFIKDFTTLGLEVDDRVRLLEELRNTFGLLLVSAPVFNGSGTTLYSVMNFLVQAQRDVVSLEAPVHWPLEGVRQVEVEQGVAGLNMEETLRSVVAVRPEVVALSSVPDRGSALLATQLASSILVVAVLPAQSAGAAVSSILEMGVPPQLLAGSIAAVTCQRLVRQVCRICRMAAEPPAPQTLANHGIAAEEAAKLKFFRGKGCPTCNKVGYRGRRAIFEVMTGAPEVRTAIQNGMSAQDIESIAIGTGMTTIRSRCLKLVAEGVTTFDEFAKLRL